MKKLVLSLLMALTLVSFSACKKCQTCTTSVEQTVFGFSQTTSTSEEYCGKEYNNAPEEGTYTQSVFGTEQKVTVKCVKS